MNIILVISILAALSVFIFLFFRKRKDVTAIKPEETNRTLTVNNTEKQDTLETQANLETDNYLIKDDASLSTFLEMQETDTSLSIKINQNFLSFILENNKVDDFLTSLLTKKIHQLDLSKNHLSRQIICALAPTLVRMLHLNKLILSETDLGPEEAIELTKCLPRLFRLQELDLSANKLSDTGVISLSTTIDTLSNLQVLDLRGNGISETGAEVLAFSTAYLPNLKCIIEKNNG